jgi:fatty acid desaturase
MSRDISRRIDSRSASEDVPSVRALRRDVINAGLLERAPVFYARTLLCSYFLLGMAAALAIHFRASFAWTLPAGVLLAVAIVQVALVGHDAGHMAVFRDAHQNHLLGMICWSLTAGVGYWYWTDRHNRHHANTNDLEDDPDLGWTALIAHDEAEARNRRGWLRTITPYQAFVAAAFVPLVAFGFRFESYAFALRKLHGVRRVSELAVLAGNIVVWLLAAAFFGWSAIALFFITQWVASAYLSFIIAPNHKGMPLWAHGTELTFVERQVLSSRNLTANRVWDVVFGGLNYQIEHHLFPQMPRVHLRRATAVVRPFCEASGLHYEVASPIRAFADIFIRAHRVGRMARLPLGVSIDSNSGD